MAAIRWRVVLAGVAAATFVSCGVPEGLQERPDELPAALRAIRGDAAAYREPTAGGIVAVDAGIVIDDLGGIVGCWGRYVPDLAGGAGAIAVKEYSVFQFTESGTFSWSMLDIPDRWFWYVIERVGTYEVIGPGTLRLTDESSTFWNPLTGVYERGDWTEGVVTDWLVTRVGDNLKLLQYGPAGADPEGAVQEDAEIFTRFDCAE